MKANPKFQKLVKDNGANSDEVRDFVMCGEGTSTVGSIIDDLVKAATGQEVVEAKVNEKEASARLERLLDKAANSIDSITDVEMEEMIKLLRAEERGEKKKDESKVNEEFQDKMMPGQKPENPEEKKKREALVTAAAKAVEAFGEDELEAYASQIKKRQQGAK